MLRVGKDKSGKFQLG